MVFRSPSSLCFGSFSGLVARGNHIRLFCHFLCSDVLRDGHIAGSRLRWERVHRSTSRDASCIGGGGETNSLFCSVLSKGAVATAGVELSSREECSRFLL